MHSIDVDMNEPSLPASQAPIISEKIVNGAPQKAFQNQEEIFFDRTPMLSRMNSMECWDYTIELECLNGPQGYLFYYLKFSFSLTKKIHKTSKRKRNIRVKSHWAYARNWFSSFLFAIGVRWANNWMIWTVEMKTTMNNGVKPVSLKRTYYFEQKRASWA